MATWIVTIVNAYRQHQLIGVGDKAGPVIAWAAGFRSRMRCGLIDQDARNRRLATMGNSASAAIRTADNNRAR